MPQSENPLVSVIIPAYNAQQTLARALESVIYQTYSHWEVIIIDDGSTDATKDLVLQYNDYPNITYLYQKNAGCGVARNNGIKHAKGTLIAFLDADDYWHYEKLETQVAIFREYPEVIVCYTESYIRDPFSELIWETKRTLFTKQRTGNMVPYVSWNNFITLSSVMVRKEKLIETGGFETRYDLMMVADWDMWLKLAPKGLFYGITTPLMFYQTRFGITRKMILENYRQITDVFYNRIKHAPPIVSIWYTVGYLRALIGYYYHRIVTLYET